MPAWPEPPDFGRMQDKPLSQLRMEARVPEKMQKLFKARLREIAHRARTEMGMSLHVEVNGHLTRKQLELLRLEIEHLAQTCGAGMEIVQYHQPVGMIERISETKIIKAKAAKG